ncbi:DNA polymerase III subunit gamma/tau [Glaciecola sp. SC05]|uniref:DNA polymerase III subunit gamma/tau n=1 Tax=Glaciecola sp. SC05 TaxID=1987355 RepID=UPI003528BD86
MSYQVLARKWRPQTFSELVGQQHVVDAITNALDNNKLHHAYLFTGTRGVGKTTIARIFSKSLNCEEGQSANPCGKCGTCLDISEGRFVDLLEIDAASRTKVEDTRELLDNVQYKPTRGKYKVYLIDEVHMLSKHSFNALLKTLEEPPPHVKFLLATTDPQKLPVTILSRCLQFSLKSLSREQIQIQLAAILDAENLIFELPALSQIARAAAGSMRDALSLTDQAIAQGNNRVTLDTVVSMLGLLDKNQVLRLAKCICERDADNAMRQLDEICADSPDYSQVLSQLLGLLHQIALTQIVPDICKLDTTVAKPIYTLSQAVSAEHIQLLYQIALNGKRDLPFAPDALTGLQMTVMRMIAFTPAQSIALEVSAPPAASEAHTDSHSDAVEQSIESASEASATKSNVSTEVSTMQQVEDTIKEQTRHPEGTSSRPPNIVTELQGSVQNDLSPLHPLKPTNVDEHEDRSSRHETIDDERAVISDPNEHQKSLGQNEHEEDGVSQLQNLFDMEQDIASYERQAAGDDDVKKSETRPDEALFMPSSKNVSESFSELDAPTPSKIDEPIYLDENVTLVDKQDAEIIEDSDSKSVAEQELPHIGEIISANDLSAYLDSGEKLLFSAQIDKWSAFVDSLNVRGLARQLLIHGRSPGIRDNCLLLEISQSHHHLNEQSSVSSVKDALLAKFGRDIDLKVEYSEVANTPYQLQLKIDEMRLAHAKQVIESDTAIQEVVKAFDAKVIEDSIESR